MPRIKRKKRGDGFQDGFSIERFLTAPFRWFFGWLGGGNEHLGENVPLHTKIIRGLIRLIWFPFFLVIQAITFVIFSWTSTRSGKAFAWGAIPLLLIGGSVACVLGAGFLEQNLTRRTLREATIDAEVAGDFEHAIVYSKRVLKIQPEDRWKFIFANTLWNSGQKENAKTIMNELAPVDSIGHINAHYWLARNALTDETVASTKDERIRICQEHCERIIESNDSDEQAKIAAALLKAKTQYLQGEIQSAIRIYERLAEFDPRVVPDLVKYLIENDRAEDAEFHTQRALRDLRNSAAQNPNNAQVWQTMYQVLLVNADFDLANAEMNLAFRQAESPSVKSKIRQLQSNLLIEFAEKFKEDSLDDRDSFVRRLIAVTQAIRYHPRNGVALNEFVDLVLYPEDETVSTWVDEESRDRVGPSMMHVIHGVKDCVAGKPVTGKSHFELAFNGDPVTAFVMNDIAWVISWVKKEHEDALKIIDVAIDTWSNSAKLYQTRGEILMHLERFDDAVIDLEYADEYIDNDFRLHDALGVCYKKLGRMEDAQNQQEIAEKMRTQAATQQKQRGG